MYNYNWEYVVFMSLFVCETCGGNIIINRDSLIGVCDSCGKSIEVNEPNFSKYISSFNKAERMMKLNSLSSLQEAESLFNDLVFIEGAKENIKLCNQKISELNLKENDRKSQKAASDKNDSRIGLIAVILIILAFLAIVGGICIIGYKIYHNSLSPESVLIGLGLIVVAIALSIISKLKG